MSTIGIPIKLLHESQGHIVTVELTNGQVYRGKLLEGISYFEFANFFKRRIIVMCNCEMSQEPLGMVV
jgi:hypothetical protein